MSYIYITLGESDSSYTYVFSLLFSEMFELIMEILRKSLLSVNQ